jgi:predicted nucleotidyltransferase component of viral defense system
MDEAIIQMLNKYTCNTSADYRNALKEIIQELTLYGLWRSKFFEHAAFYGGTALRIIHGLNRFSEDLDFSLIKPDASYDLSSYENSVRRELEAFGFTLEVEVKQKNAETAIQSAFLKGNTLEHLLKIGMPSLQTKHFNPEEKIKIKFEVDTDPPPRFQTEAIPVYAPVPFSVRTYRMPDMFAGKLSALLFRQWQQRIKGRDWYDFLWFVGKKIPINLDHLQARLEQIGVRSSQKILTLEELQELIHHKIDQLDLKLAQDDVIPFIKDQSYIRGWSKDLFHETVKRISIEM